MNKKITAVLAAALSAVCLLSSCGGAAPGSSSSEGNAAPKLGFVGDLQALYGGEKGYPQAALIAKTQFIEDYEEWINNELISEIAGGSEWLASADTQTIVSAVSSHLTEGMTSSFNVDNLSETVISHCGIRWESAADSKAEVNDFLDKLIAVNAQAAGEASDAFYYVSVEHDYAPGDGAATGYPAPSSAEIYMPDGAPALSMAKLLNEDEEDDGVNYHVVDSTAIQTYVTGEKPQADICVLPVNLAAKLFGRGDAYRLLGIVTHGNLYMLSTDADTQYTTENLSGLIGKTVGVIQLPNVPGLTLKVILNQNDIPWQELGNDGTAAADKVNLKAIDVGSVNPAAGLDCYVVSEPAASAKVGK